MTARLLTAHGQPGDKKTDDHGPMSGAAECRRDLDSGICHLKLCNAECCSTSSRQEAALSRLPGLNKTQIRSPVDVPRILAGIAQDGGLVDNRLVARTAMSLRRKDRQRQTQICRRTHAHNTLTLHLPDAPRDRSVTIWPCDRPPLPSQPAECCHTWQEAQRRVPDKRTFARADMSEGERGKFRPLNSTKVPPASTNIGHVWPESAEFRLLVVELGGRAHVWPESAESGPMLAPNLAEVDQAWAYSGWNTPNLAKNGSNRGRGFQLCRTWAGIGQRAGVSLTDAVLAWNHRSRDEFRAHLRPDRGHWEERLDAGETSTASRGSLWTTSRNGCAPLRSEHCRKMLFRFSGGMLRGKFHRIVSHALAGPNPMEFGANSIHVGPSSENFRRARSEVRRTP